MSDDRATTPPIAGLGLFDSGCRRPTRHQPEAAPALASANGRYAMEPGFWHGITVVQALGAPILTIRSARNGHVILSWPATATGFVLEETPALSQTKWTETKADVVDTAAEHTVTVPAADVMKCYRLKKL